MSKNHYSRQVLQLEALMASKMKQLHLLETEHSLLQDKEAALQNAIHSIEGPLALVKDSLNALSPGTSAQPSPCTPSTPAPAPAPAPPAAAPPSAAAAPAHVYSALSWSSSTQSAAPCISNPDPDGCMQVEQSGASVTSAAATGLAAAAYKDGSGLLHQLDKREGKVQRVLQQLGSIDSADYHQLYTSQLMRKAMADPQRMAGYLKMPRAERLQYWSQAHTGMALLLGKYDSNINLTSGNVRAQLDHLVDELFERVVVCALLDPPDKHMSCFMFNVDTQEFEQYPDGWWRQVAEGMRLSAADKAAIRLVWDRQQQQLQLLGQEWEQLQQQLQQLHLQQLQSNRQFEQAIRELPALLTTLNVAERSRQEKKAVQQQQAQQQQQQAQQQQQPVQQQQPSADPALAELLTCWRQQSLDSVAVEDGLMAELASELVQERQLQQQVQALLQEQQQQQQGWGGRAGGASTPQLAGGAGVAAAPTAPLPQSTRPGAVVSTSETTSQSHSSLPGTVQDGFARAAVAGAYTELGAAEEVLLQEGSQERRWLEQRIAACTHKMKVLHYCLALHFTNRLTKWQLAAMCVHSHPFVFDCAGICAALEEAGWE